MKRKRESEEQPMLPMLGSVKKPRKLPRRRSCLEVGLNTKHALLVDFLSEEWGCTKTEALKIAVELVAELVEKGEIRGRVVVQSRRAKRKPQARPRDEQAAYIEALRIVLGLRPVYHQAAGTDRAAFETEGEKPTF